MARSRRDINWDVVEKLAQAGCSGIEIAAKFGMQDDTFYRRFKQEYGKSYQDFKGMFFSTGNADLKAMLHAKAINNSAPGNTNTLIFLAKTRLGMREPDPISHIAANQPQIDQSHYIMTLENKIAELEANANKSQAE